MFAWLRLVCLCLLAVALPVQGTLAATRIACGPQGQEVVRAGALPEAAARPHTHRSHAVDAADARRLPAAASHHGGHDTTAHAHAADQAADPAADQAADQAADPAADPSDDSAGCSVCAACCPGAPLPTAAMLVDVLPAATAPPVHAEAHAPVFLTAAPERPPRILAA